MIPSHLWKPPFRPFRTMSKRSRLWWRRWPALVATMARKADEAEAKLANAHAHQSAIEALIAHLKLQIAKLERFPQPLNREGFQLV